MRFWRFLAGAIVLDWLFGNRHKTAARTPRPYTGTDFCDGDCCDTDAAIDCLNHECCDCDPDLVDDYGLDDELDELEEQELIDKQDELDLLEDEEDLDLLDDHDDLDLLDEMDEMDAYNDDDHW